MLAEALLSILLLAEVAALLLLLRLRRKLSALEDAVVRAEARGQEQARRLATLDRMCNNQQLAEHAIDTGTNVVRGVHGGIAGIPFSVLENISSTAPAARAARKLHDRISSDIYDAISGINRTVGKHLRSGIGDEGDEKGVDTSHHEGRTKRTDPL